MREVSRKIASEAVRTKLSSLSDAQLGLVFDIMFDEPVLSTRITARSRKDDVQVQNLVDSDWDD